MRGGDYSYLGIQLEAWNVTEDRLPHRYFPAIFLKLVTTGTTVASTAVC